jgi:hypothetical protein
VAIVHAQLSEFYSVVAYAVEHIGAVLRPFAFETICGHYARALRMFGVGYFPPNTPPSK